MGRESTSNFPSGLFGRWDLLVDDLARVNGDAVISGDED